MFRQRDLYQLQVRAATGNSRGRVIDGLPSSFIDKQFFSTGTARRKLFVISVKAQFSHRLNFTCYVASLCIFYMAATLSPEFLKASGTHEYEQITSLFALFMY